MGGTGVGVAVGPGVAVIRMGGWVGARLPNPGSLRAGSATVGPPGAPLAAAGGLAVEIPR
ncbi:MAG: hypothetical protein U0232_22410 [Thermomicrobiales bacterium]